MNNVQTTSAGDRSWICEMVGGFNKAHLHITYLPGFSVTLSVWHIQILLLGTFWNIFLDMEDQPYSNAAIYLLDVQPPYAAPTDLSRIQI